MGFTDDQRAEIYQSGYTVLRRQVPPGTVDAAVKAINHSLGEGLDPALLPTLRSQSYCPELGRSEVILNLFNQSGARALAESVLGIDSFSSPANGQIALRFPRADNEIPPFRPHLDGFPTPTNGVKAGTIGSFTALVGVLLSPLPKFNSGNFTVLPGTHRSTEAYFQEHGPKAFLNGFPPIDEPDPVQITGEPGDMVFCHYQLAHGIAANVSLHIRYAVFFRISHQNHADDKEARVADIWRDWPGMDDLKR